MWNSTVDEDWQKTMVSQISVKALFRLPAISLHLSSLSVSLAHPHLWLSVENGYKPHTLSETDTKCLWPTQLDINVSFRYRFPLAAGYLKLTHKEAHPKTLMSCRTVSEPKVMNPPRKPNKNDEDEEAEQSRISHTEGDSVNYMRGDGHDNRGSRRNWNLVGWWGAWVGWCWLLTTGQKRQA